MRKKVTLILSFAMVHSSFSQEIYDGYVVTGPATMFHTIKTKLQSVKKKLVTLNNRENTFRFVAVMCIMGYLIIKMFKKNQPQQESKIESYFRQIKIAAQERMVCGFRAVDFIIRIVKMHLTPDSKSALEQSMRSKKVADEFIQEYEPKMSEAVKKLHLSQRIEALLDCPEFHVRPDDYDGWVEFYESKKNDPRLAKFTKEDLLHSEEFKKLYEKEVLEHYDIPDINFDHLTPYEPIQESGIYHEELLNYYERRKNDPRFSNIPPEQRQKKLLRSDTFRKEYELEKWKTNLDNEEIDMDKLLNYMSPEQRNRLNNYCEAFQIPKFCLPREDYEKQVQSFSGDLPTNNLLDLIQVKELTEKCRADLLIQGISLPEIIVCSETHELRSYLTGHKENLKKEGIYAFIINAFSQPGAKNDLGHWIAAILETYHEDKSIKMMVTFGDSLNTSHLNDHIAQVFTSALNLDVKDKIYDIGPSQ